MAKATGGPPCLTITILSSSHHKRVMSITTDAANVCTSGDKTGKSRAVRTADALNCGWIESRQSQSRSRTRTGKNSNQNKPIITLRGGNRLFLCYARNMSEHTEQVRFFAVLSLYSGNYPLLGRIFAVPNGGHRNKIVAHKMKQEGVRRGVPDIIVPYPRQGYTSLAIEMKFHPEKQSPEQKEYQAILETERWLYLLCYSTKEAVHGVGHYLGIQELIEYDEL